MFSRHFTRLVTLAVVAVLAFALAPAMSERAHAAGGVLAYGDVVNGQIDNVSYFELWEFSGTKGDHIQLLMEGDGKLDPYLGIIESASEQVLAEDDDSGGNSNAYIEMTLPSTGTFSVVATRYNFDAGDSQGKYTLSLAGSGTTQTTGSDQPTTTTEPVELEAGVWYMGDIVLAESVSGSIDQNAYAQFYSVNLEAGTELVVVMFADGSTLDPYLILMTEDGDVLAEDDDGGAQRERW
jgi:serine protease Do